MKLRTLVLASSLAGLTLGLTPVRTATLPRGDSVKVTWERDSFGTDELPEDLPEGTRDALSYFADWAAEMDYVIQLSEDASFAMFTHRKKFSARDWSKAIAPALELVDELVPLPERESSDAETGQAEAPPSNQLVVSWGDVHELEHDAVSFFEVKNSEHMASLLEYIAKQEGKPEGWSSPFVDLPGLLLHQPLAGVLVATAPGVEEWDPLNEMVNRIARLKLVRRFRTVPYWITLGVAWNVEFDVRGNLYCFPHRDHFVGVAEHNGWRDTLKVQFKDRDGPLLDMQQLAGWQVGTYDPVQAARAWGTISYITQAKPGALGEIIEELRLLTDEKGRITHADGTWERIPNFSPSAEDQLEVLTRHLGESFLEDVTAYFNKGMKKPAGR